VRGVCAQVSGFFAPRWVHKDKIPSHHACNNEGDYRGAHKVVTTVDTAQDKQQYAESEWAIPVYLDLTGKG
jgi:hypothetical protein